MTRDFSENNTNSLMVFIFQNTPHINQNRTTAMAYSNQDSSSKEAAHRAVVRELQSKQRGPDHENPHGGKDGADERSKLEGMELYFAAGIGAIGAVIGILCVKGLR
ncbi:hypothetical protein ACN47E_000899 [Coniothyrium glycines]